MRDFSYNEADVQNGKTELIKLLTEKKKQFVSRHFRTPKCIGKSVLCNVKFYLLPALELSML